MVTNPPAGYPRISPYLCYPDADEAIAFLTVAFGFELRMKLPGPDGRTGHAELTFADDGVVMIGSPGRDFANHRHERPEVLIHAYVDDVDAHHERSKAAGADIDAPPQTMFYGDRRYTVKDCGGHVWTFSQRVEDVSEEEMERRASQASPG